MRRKSVRVKKKITKLKLKKKVWEWFSKYIRLRDSNQYGQARCCTCDKMGSWKTFQAGHFIDGRTNEILFDESLVHAQCVRCNIMLSGNKIHYVMFMKTKYGLTDAEILEMEKRKHKSRQFSTCELEEMAHHFKDLARYEAGMKNVRL